MLNQCVYVWGSCASPVTFLATVLHAFIFFSFVVTSLKACCLPGPLLDLRSPMGISPIALSQSAPPSASQTATKQQKSQADMLSAQRSYKVQHLADLAAFSALKSPARRDLALSAVPAQWHACAIVLSLNTRTNCTGPSGKCRQDFQAAREALVRTSSRQRQRAEAVDFKRVWWDRGARSPTSAGLSIWRPVPPAGYAALGGHPGSAALLWPFLCGHIPPPPPRAPQRAA